MKTKKMSLANIQGKLSRAEMKKIMAGSGGTVCAIRCQVPNATCRLEDQSTGHCQFITDLLCCLP